MLCVHVYKNATLTIDIKTPIIPFIKSDESIIISCEMNSIFL